ncbi:MAG: S8 family serine peptidase [Alphaproteobacteria bacterium]|nr:S8 family serine peptidase [Alphaproteobacteria bacterium]
MQRSHPCKKSAFGPFTRRFSFVFSLGLTATAAMGLIHGGAQAQQPESFSPQFVQNLLERPAPAQFVPGEVIVKFKPGTRARGAMTAQELTPMGLQSSPRQTSGGEFVYRFTPSVQLEFQSLSDAEVRIEATVNQLNARDDVEWAQPNWILQPVDTTPNDPRFVDQWHYFNNGTGTDESPGGINLPKAWDVGTGSSAVVVAVIDTGILPAHPDIVGSPNLVAGFDMISSTFMANDGGGRDADATDPGDAVTANECRPGSRARRDSWHGTHVAGTVGVGNTNNGAGVAGVNWAVTVVPVRVLGKCGGTIVDINDGIRWAAGLAVPGVPNNPNPARVINMSLGGRAPCSASPSTQAAIDDAIGAGVTVVVAAGNDAMDAAGAFPASCNNVIAVAASDYRGNLVTRYSNFGTVVDIMAPGGDVLSDVDGDGNVDGVLSMVNGTYAFYNGTSMAAPHVAGVAALMLEADGSLTPAEIENRIKANAMPRTAAQCPQPCGAGLLNAHFKRDAPREEPTGFEYAAKLVCGIQKDPERLMLVRGVYGTTINIHNPNNNSIVFTKKLALTVPPGFQKPGKVIRISKDKLGPDEALAVDCDDLRKRLGGFPTPVIEGFIVLQSKSSLDVTAVYTTAALDRYGRIGDHSGIHVEQIKERLRGDSGGQADLTVKDIDLSTLKVDCPTGGGSCVTTVEVTIENIGTGATGPFNTRNTLDPAGSVNVDEATPGLAPGEPKTYPVTTPPGGNCFDPDCTICVRVDNNNEVPESDEGNNLLCKTKIG